jgi:hypothetical protein
VHVFGIFAVVALIIVCATALIGLHKFLNFGRDALKQSNSESKTLRDAAVLVRAFRPATGGLLSALAKLFERATNGSSDAVSLDT